MKVMQLSLAIATTLVVTQGVNAKPVHISQDKDMFVAINYNPGSYQSRRNRSRFMNRVRRDRFNRTQTNRNRVINSPRFLPNLQVSSISWGGEFCNLTPCAKDLKRIGLNKATCPIVVRVMNTGRMRSRLVMVSLTYI